MCIRQQAMAPNQKLCVYCGSGPGINPIYVEAARTLGKSIADKGLGLVYGGGSLGLMGETARSVIDAGGHVTGIIPDFLVRREQMLTDVQQLIVTQDMHERKMTMFEHADGFVALPGGVAYVSLNGIGLGEVVDPVPVHEGQLGFGFRSYGAGSEMTLDEFRVEPEAS